MRSVTFAQAFQFWLKLTALMLPALVLGLIWHGDHAGPGNGYATADRTTVVGLSAPTAVQVPVASMLTIDGQLDGQQVRGRLPVAAGDHLLGPATVTLESGDVIPVLKTLPALTNASWASPLGSGRPHPLYSNLSLILAICLGTMGLPHVLVRFYTNSTGQQTRRTAVIVIMLLSLFYLFPTILGALGRRYAPDLLLTGRTDATVLLLPERLVGGLGGELLGALVTAGAFAAFLSTASGLAVSVAGVISQDVRWRRVSQVRAFRAVAVPAIGVPYLLSLPSEHLGLAAVVGLAFAVAAATFCPLLVLGIWWRGLTAAGAVAGLTVGGLIALIAVIVTITVPPHGGWPAALLAQPAAWAVPFAFVVMISVSLLTRRSLPADVAMSMVRLHAPESLDLDRGIARPAAPAADQLIARIDHSPAQIDRLG
jgi:Na+(H+)/acetate symporter ActP